jgi:hypothetical protein
MTIELKRNNVPTKEGCYFIFGKQYVRPDFVKVVMFDGCELWNKERECGLGCGTTSLSKQWVQEAQWSDEITFRGSLH